MARRKRSSLYQYTYDPDYRLAPWNKSAFAPRNSGKRDYVKEAAIPEARRRYGSFLLSKHDVQLVASEMKLRELNRMLDEHGPDAAITREIKLIEPMALLAKERKERDSGVTRGCMSVFLFVFMVGVTNSVFVTVAGVDPESDMAAYMLLFTGIVMFVGWRVWKRRTKAPGQSPQPAVTPAPVNISPADQPLPQTPLPANEYEKFIYDQPPIEPRSHAERGREFEEQVARLINAGSRYKAVVVGGANDGGVDIQLLYGADLIGVVQCKRYKGLVPPDAVRSLATVMRQQQVRIGYLFTTGRFSENTCAEAEALGIRLIDGERFEELKRKADQKTKARRMRP